MLAALTSDGDEPPYRITPAILNRVAAISETLGRLSPLSEVALRTATPQVAPQVNPQVGKLLQQFEGEMSREALQERLGLKDRQAFRARYLKPALEAGLIEMTRPDKPTSRSQRYRLTEAGQAAWRAEQHRA